MRLFACRSSLKTASRGASRTTEEQHLENTSRVNGQTHSAWTPTLLMTQFPTLVKKTLVHFSSKTQVIT